MSSTIDQKVVEMRFDNRQFESNVSTTMSTLDKLKQKLNLTGAAKGFDDVGRAAKMIDMSGLGRGIEQVGLKFNAMYTIADQALRNITNRVQQTAENMVKALTIDPIKTGFQEYETQINSVQTILANTQSKGSTLQDVNRALAELNTYADKTIYNFTEMTRNIGTFTAAGIELDTSVSAIQGIANLAAISGSTSQQASTAMYQLSQALASGTVKLMDWNSVVNAGMGGQVFQDALKKTSKELNTGAEAAIKAKGSFRESLSTGWLTAEVLTETLKKMTTSGANEYVAKYTGLSVTAVEAALESAEAQYGEANAIKEASKALAEKSGKSAEEIESTLSMAKTAEEAATKVKTFTQLWDTLKEAAQSGWTQSWQTIIGDFGEAKELLTSISDVVGNWINESSNARNKVLTEGLSTGWKQLLNQGIADEEGYKESIISVAKERGIAIDKMIDDSGSFEKSLKEGWLTSDILAESLDKLVEKTKGLSDEELKAMGYTRKQVMELEKLNESVKNGSVNLDEFADKLKVASGRENVIEGLKNIFVSIIDVIKPVKEAFREIFPAMTGDQLYAITENFKTFTERLKVSAEMAEKIKRTFKGVFAVFDIGVEAIKALGRGALDVIKNVSGMFELRSGILDITASFGDYLVGLRDSIIEGNLFGTVVDRLVGYITKGAQIVKQFAGSVKDFGISIKNALTSPDYEGVVIFFKSLGRIVSNVYNSIKNALTSPSYEGVVAFFTTLGRIISNVSIAISKALGGVGRTLSDIFGKGDIFEVLNTGLLTAIVLNIQKFTKSFSSIDSIMDNVTGILDDVRGCFQAYQDQLKADTLLKIAKAIAILAASIFVISFIDSDKLADSLGAITLMFAELVGSLVLLTKISSNITGVVKSISLMVGMSVSILILSTALVILSSAIERFSGMKWGELAKGLIGLGVSLGILVAALRFVPKNWSASFEGFGIKSKTKLISAGITMIAMATAMKILAAAVKDFGSLKWGELGKGLLGMAGAIAILVIALRRMPKNVLGSMSKHMVGLGIGMIAMATAMKILASAVKDFGSLKWGEIGKGLIAMSGAMISVIFAMKRMPKNLVSIGVGLVVVGGALKILANVMSDFGAMSWGEIGRGLVTMGIALAELAIGLNLMKSTASGSASLLIAAVAIGLMVPTIKSLGNIPVTSIVKGLVTLASAMAIIGIAAALLQPVLPAMLGLAGAMALIGISVALVGGGLLAISIAFSALTTSVTIGATALVSALTIIIVGIIDLIPAIAQAIGRGIVELCKVVGDYAPQIADSLLKLISEVLSSLATYTPKIVDSLLAFLIDTLNVLSQHMPELVQAAMNFLGSLFRGIAEALNGVDTDNLLKSIAAVGLMTVLMRALSKVKTLAPGALAGLVNVGIVIAGMAVVLAALGGLTQIPGLQWLMSEGGNFLETLGTALGQFVGGLAGGIAKGITGVLPGIATSLSEFMINIQPFAVGLKAVVSSVSVKDVVVLSSLFLAMTGVVVILSKMNINVGNAIRGIAGLTMMVVPLVAFAEGLKKLNGLEISVSNVIVLTVLMYAMTGLLAILSIIGTSGLSALKGIALLTAMWVPMWAFIDIIKRVSGIDIAKENVLILAGLMAVMTVLLGLLTIIGIGAPFALLGVLALTAMWIPMWAFIDIIKRVSGIDIASENVMILMDMMQLMTKLLTQLAIIGPFALIGLAAMQGLILLIGEIAIFATAIGALVEAFPSLQTFLDTGLPILEQLAGSIGTMVGKFVGNMGEALGDSLVKIGDDIVGFMTRIQMASMISSGIKGSSFDGVKDLIEVLAGVGVTTVGMTISDIFTSGGTSMERFEADGKAFFKAIKAISTEMVGFSFPEDFSAEGLTTLLNALKSVSTATIGLTFADMFTKAMGDKTAMEKFEEDGKAFFKAIKAISTEMVGFSFPEDFSIEGLDTLLGALKSVSQSLVGVTFADMFAKVVGDQTAMEKFQTDGVAFFKAIKAISNEMTGFTFTEEFSVEGLNKLFEVLKSVGTYTKGATWDDIFTLGGTSIEKFQADGVGLFSAIKAISTEASGISLSSFSLAESAIARIKGIIASVKDVDYSGVEEFTGIGTGGFGADGPMHDIGVALKDFGDQVVGINIAAVDTSVKAASDIISIIRRLVGLDTSGIEKFKAKAIGTAMKDYNSQVEGIDTGTIASSISSANRIISLIRSLVGLDSSGVELFNPKPIGEKMKAYSESVSGINSEAVSSSISSATSLKNFINSLAGLNTSGVASFKEAVTNLSDIQLDGFIESFKGISTSLMGIGRDLINGLANGMKSAQGSVTSALASMSNSMINAIRSKYGLFQNTGTTLTMGFSNGVSSQRAVVASSIRSCLASAVSSANNYYSSFYSAGSYVVTGFANGISANAYQAVAKATAMALAAKRAAEEALGINSPSKVFYQIGDYVGQGFTNALGDYDTKTFEAGASMADYARKGLSNAISRINDALNSDMDTQPTIRPVIDLSNVQTGAAAINGLFSNGVSIGAMANVRSISSIMANRNQNGSNDDVISAINKLNDNLANASGDTYSINGITYDDGSNISTAIKDIVREARMERRR